MSSDGRISQNVRGTPESFSALIDSHSVSNEAFSALYREVGLWSAVPDQSRRIHRWQDPVRIALIGTLPPSAEEVVSVHAAFLSAATGHTVDATGASNAAGANLGVLCLDNPIKDITENYWDNISSMFGEDRRQARRFAEGVARSAPGSTELHIRLDRRVVAGCLVAVPASLGALEFYAVLAPALMRAMGLLGSLSSFAHSVLLAGGMRLEPSPLDRLLLAVHYDQRLAPGMEERAVTAALEAIVADRRSWGGFDGLTTFSARGS
jgi:hypothetical protein